MAWKHSSFVLGMVLAVGCGDLQKDAANGVEERRGALLYAKQNVMVPAYFDPQNNAADFDTLGDWDNHNSKRAIKLAIVNLGCEWEGGWNPSDPIGACQPDPNGRRIAGGPGSGHEPAIGARWTALVDKVQRFHNSGMEVYGYVDYYPNRPAWNVDQDIAAWYAFGQNLGFPIDGIFFDEADRDGYTQNRLARAVYYTNHTRLSIHRPGFQGRVIFNYGVTKPSTGQYVSCLANLAGVSNMFVTQERRLVAGGGDHGFDEIDPWAEFGSNGNSAWMNNRRPDHFINIVHTVPSNITLPMYQDLVNKTRILNAGLLYVTNGVHPGNTFGHLAQNSVLNPGVFPLFNYLEGNSAGDTAEYAHGSASDPPAGFCPPQNHDALE